MLGRVFGTKVGMTQLFGSDRRVAPVTVIELGTWFVTQIKTQEKDGYSAVQVATPRERYLQKQFSTDWLKDLQKYFLFVRELSPTGDAVPEVGYKLSLSDFVVKEGDIVGVSGTSKGLGFQGVMRRWGFAGGPGGHGSTFHRGPGSIGNLVFRGEVFKGKKLPGHMGCRSFTVKSLSIVKVEKDTGYLFIRGAVPGKKGSLVMVRSEGW